MGDARRTSEQRVVAMDYGQFTLVGGDFDDGWDSGPLLEEAFEQAAPAVAGDGRMLLVLSPHQNSFALELTVEVWDGEPAGDSDDWEQVVRGWLDVEGDRLLYESPTLAIESFDVPTGRYAVEVSGRGFVATGWPGSTTPGDVWRVRLWPSEVVHPAYAVRTWADPQTWDAAPGTLPADAASVSEIDAGDGPPTGFTVTGDGAVLAHHDQPYDEQEPAAVRRMRERGGGDRSRADAAPEEEGPFDVVEMSADETRALYHEAGMTEEEIDELLSVDGLLADADAAASPVVGFVVFGIAAHDHDGGLPSSATYEETTAAQEEAVRRFAERVIEPPQPLDEP